MVRPTIDDLKRARDGHLGWGERLDIVDPYPGMEWAIERDQEGAPVSMWWRGPEVRQAIREWVERQKARRRPR